MRASGARHLLDVDRRLGAEIARQPQPRLLRSADGDHAARAHFLRRRHRQNADRAGALDHHRVIPAEAACLHRPVERADARGQRLGERAEQQAHIVGQLVDLGAGQLAEIDIDIFGPAAPEMRRLVEAEIAAVIDRRQAFIRGLGIMQAPVAMAAGHQWRQHQFRADADRLAHEVGLQLVADLDHDARQFVSEGERPRQRLRPMAFQDMLVGAADAAGPYLDQRRFRRDARPGHLLHHRIGARPGEGGYSDRRPGARACGHGFSCRGGSRV